MGIIFLPHGPFTNHIQLVKLYPEWETDNIKMKISHDSPFDYSEKHRFLSSNHSVCGTVFSAYSVTKPIGAAKIP